MIYEQCHLESNSDSFSSSWRGSHPDAAGTEDKEHKRDADCTSILTADLMLSLGP